MTENCHFIVLSLLFVVIFILGISDLHALKQNEVLKTAFHITLQTE